MSEVHSLVVIVCDGTRWDAQARTWVAAQHAAVVVAKFAVTEWSSPDFDTKMAAELVRSGEADPNMTIEDMIERFGSRVASGRGPTYGTAVWRLGSSRGEDFLVGDEPAGNWRLEDVARAEDAGIASRQSYSFQCDACQFGPVEVRHEKLDPWMRNLSERGVPLLNLAHLQRILTR